MENRIYDNHMIELEPAIMVGSIELRLIHRVFLP